MAYNIAEWSSITSNVRQRITKDLESPRSSSVPDHLSHYCKLGQSEKDGGAEITSSPPHLNPRRLATVIQAHARNPTMVGRSLSLPALARARVSFIKEKPRTLELLTMLTPPIIIIGLIKKAFSSTIMSRRTKNAIGHRLSPFSTKEEAIA